VPPARPLLLLAALVLVAAALFSTGGSEARFVGREARSAALCPTDMVWVPAGPFQAGATGEDVALPAYQPDIARDPRPPGLFKTEDFCIDRYEWPGKGHRPVADVTWLQARVACEARGKRLCSEDEWVKSCGGTLGWLMPYGDLKVVGLCHADVTEEGSYDSVVPAGSVPTCRSPYGTFDQEGNISEWVEDARSPDSPDRWVLGGTMWPGVYGRGCQARHAHPQVAPVAGDDGFRCCISVSASR
jgi:eukaryotic-like serine/threonine-protein kinase